MSIATELTRIIDAKSDIKTSIEAKGVSVPSNATIDTYYDYVDNIPTGVGTPLVESTDVSDFSGNSFDAISQIKGVIIPASVTSFSSTTPFSGVTNIESIVVESGNTVFDSRNDCNAVMQTSNNKLIAGCDNTIIPNDTVTIGQYALDGCTGLSGSLTIPNTVTSIEQYAFNGCTGITSLSLSNSVTTIGNYAFQRCSSLTGTLTIPDSVNTIGQYAFNGSPNITKIVLPNKNISFGQTVFAGAGVTSVGVIGSGADVELSSLQTSLPTNFLGDCPSLISVELPEGLTTLGQGAFHTSGVQTVILPSTLQTTGWGVFTRSYNLRTLTCKAVTPPSIGSSWLETRSLQAIYVPAESVETYKTASYWSSWASYIQAIPTT